MSIVAPYDYDAESISKVCAMTARITIEKEGIFKEGISLNIQD